MNRLIAQLLTLETPLPQAIATKRANCFNAIQLFWEEASGPVFTGPADFVAYLDANFEQRNADEKHLPNDVTVIWSRSSNELPAGQIRIDALNRRDVGYPFGLIIEHAFVQLEDRRVFQKRDPTELGPYEVLTVDQALEPYLNLSGFELTRHRRK